MDLLVRNAAQLVTPLGVEAACGSAMRHVHILSDAAVLVRDGLIAWVGASAAVPPLAEGTVQIDATGKVVLPGFVDSHTHLIFAGSREGEFEQRLAGATYQEIAARGGGIQATVTSVRAASRDQ